MHVAGENIDRVMNLEIRRPGPRQGIKWPLYTLARRKLEEPMVLAAARSLDCPPRRIGIVSGAAVPERMPNGENDGPFGSVVLSRALLALGHRPSIYTDAECAESFRVLLRHYDLDVPVVNLALGDTAGQEGIARAEDHLIAIERLGGNINGQLYGVTGVSRSAHRANVDHLFRTAAALGKPTLGIGDGGNEIGFGNVHAELWAECGQHAMVDTTPCGGGIFSVVETDLLVVASTSNLGAYGVVAALALLRRDSALCHRPQRELVLHDMGVELGLADGSTGRVLPWCDGVPAECSAAVVQIMQGIVEQSMQPAVPRGF